MTTENNKLTIIIPSSFDEEFYQDLYPEVKTFILAYATQQGWSDRERLWIHYEQYGKQLGMQCCPKTIYIKPTQGLGNRLLLLDSIYAFAIANAFDKIKLCWCESQGFSDETFEELFDVESLPKIFSLISKEEYEHKTQGVFHLHNCFKQNSDSLEYEFSTGRDKTYGDIKNINFCYESYASIDWIFGISLQQRCTLLKNHIKPSAKLQEVINQYEVSNKVGLHIRRGDAIIGPWAKYYKESKDEHFEQIIEENEEVFLCTDCQDTESSLRNKFPGKIKSINKDFVRKGLTIYDNKPLQKDAVVDMFVLSKTKEIFGTNWSTFNEVASIIGGNKLTRLHKSEKCYNSKPFDGSISIVCACMNRFEALCVSIQSWINQPLVKQIIITDWSSIDFDKEYLESLDDRIQVVTIHNESHFQLSKAYNEAIKKVDYENILKLDVDYIINPYMDISTWLISTEDSFLTGNWEDKSKDCHIGFLEHLNGFLFCSAKHIRAVGGYQGNKHGYGFDDCDLYNRLESIGLTRRYINHQKNNVPIFHIPHGDCYRSEFYEEKDIKLSHKKNREERCA